MIVSVHLPRTGGTSFLHYLRSQFNVALIEDYSWMATPADPESLERCACVHGHFFPQRYLGIADGRFAFWFREPLSRLRSHYLFWQQNEFPGNAAWASMHAEQWSFEQFALARDDSIKNLQSQMLSVLRINQLAFVGLTEEYERSLRLFARIFGLPAEIPYRLNRGTMARGGDEISSNTLNVIRRMHAEDLEVYGQAQRRFDELTFAYNI